MAKLFACFNKYNSHFWRYPKMSLGNWQQLWQLWKLGNFGNCCLAGRLKKGLSQCRNATRCSLITSYLFWQWFELFFFMLTASRKYRCNCCNVTEALKASSAGAWDCQPLGLSTCLSVCLPVYQFLRPAGHSWADDVNSGRRFEYAWRGLEDVVAVVVVDFFHAFHVQRDHSMAT